MRYEFIKNGLIPCALPSFDCLVESDVIDECEDFQYSQKISSTVEVVVHGCVYDGSAFIRCYEKNLETNNKITVLAERKITKQLGIKDYIKSLVDHYLINNGIKLSLIPLSFIYFIKADRFIKIGVSNNPPKRISTIKTGNPFDCEFIGCVMVESKYAYTLESLLHDYFINYRESGEWFSMSVDDILNVIRYLKFGKVLVSEGKIIIPQLNLN